jgi:hypothetical protein
VIPALSEALNCADLAAGCERLLTHGTNQHREMKRCEAKRITAGHSCRNDGAVREHTNYRWA